MRWNAVRTLGLLVAIVLVSACSGPGATPSAPTALRTPATATVAATVSQSTILPTVTTTISAPTANAGSPGPPAGNIAACGIRSIPPSTVRSTPHMGTPRMITPTIGWATTTGVASDYAVVRTTDGGTHWTAVSPSGIWDHLVATTAFLGMYDSWIVLILDDLPPNQPGARMVTLATHDSGQSWQCGEPFVPGGTINQMRFTDAQHGSMQIGASVAAGSTADIVFATDDGGAHWARRPAVSA